MNARVAELLDTLQNTQAELELIRKNCPHPTYYIGFWGWRIGSRYPSRICEDCNMLIPGITLEEETVVRERKGFQVG